MATPKKPAAKPKRAAKKTPTSSAQKPAVIAEGYAQLRQRSTAVREYTGDADIADKRALVGKPFVVVGWTWRDSDFEDATTGYVSVSIITEDGEAMIFNDGGVGIRPALETAEATGGNPAEGGIPLDCPNGLRASEYTGPKGPAVTYYFG